jgi:hypothetical protein
MRWVSWTLLLPNRLKNLVHGHLSFKGFEARGWITAQHRANLRFLPVMPRGLTVSAPVRGAVAAGGDRSTESQRV